MPTTEWSNWTGNRSCVCDVVRPENLAELQTAVASAATGTRRVRPAGTGYSWTPLIPVPGDGTIVETAKLDRLLGVRTEVVGGVEHHYVKVEAGMKMSELIEITRSRGLTLRSPTLFPWPSIAGALSTGSHGVGRRGGCFADSLHSLDIVDATGSLRTVTRGDADFPAAMVALGSLGMIYAAELEVSPEFNVYVDKRNVPVDRTLAEFDDLIEAYDYLEMFWMPGAETFYLMLMDESGAHADEWSFRRKAEQWIDTTIQSRAANVWVPWIAQHAPGLTPVLTKLAGGTVTEVEKEIVPASDAFHFQKAYSKNWDIAYSIPATHAAEAWSRAIDLVNDYAEAGAYPINYALHGRFVGPGEGWIAPNHDRYSLYIEATTAIGTPGFQGLFDELEARWAGIPGARPHWGKHFGRTTGLDTLYPRMADFLAVRQAWDPGRHFLNPWLEHDVFDL